MTRLLAFPLIGALAAILVFTATRQLLPVRATETSVVGEPIPATVIDVEPQSALVGVATWYQYHRGQAAAGPALRRAIGKGRWRGSVVVVRFEDVPPLRVKLTDWCACRDRNGKPTLIDLDYRDFGQLAPLGIGVIDVVVEYHQPVGPRTDVGP